MSGVRLRHVLSRPSQQRSALSPWAIALAEPDGLIWHQWLLFNGMALLLLYLASRYGLPQQLLAGDSSRISLLIAVVYGLFSVYAGWRSRYLSTLHRSHALPSCTLRCPPDKSFEAWMQALDERLKGPHDIGWYAGGLALKLGLLGTVVGFVAMLGSLERLGDGGDSPQVLIRQIGSGMAVSLFTTVSGLLASMGLSAQFLLLDRGAERLLSRMRQLHGSEAPL